MTMSKLAVSFIRVPAEILILATLKLTSPIVMSVPQEWPGQTEGAERAVAAHCRTPVAAPRACLPSCRWSSAVCTPLCLLYTSSGPCLGLHGACFSRRAPAGFPGERSGFSCCVLSSVTLCFGHRGQGSSYPPAPCSQNLTGPRPLRAVHFHPRERAAR